MKTKNILLLIFTFSFAYSVLAQEEGSETSAAEMAKQLANPNATLGQMLVPIDFIRYNGDINDAGQTGMVFNFQPSLPIPLSDGLNLYVRPLIPVYLSQPVLGASGFEKKAGFGNISADIAVGKTWPSKWITLVGVFGGFPTASNDALRASQVTLGPEFMVAKLTNFGAVGLILSQAWGLGDPSDPDASSSTVLPDDIWLATDDPASANITAGQYFYTINLKNGWQINATPTYAYNHNGTDGNKFTFPLGTGAQKVLKAGKMPLRLGMQYWYYIASPDAFGPAHQIRFTIAPVVPLPW
ncbi:MAG: hypothetical protein ABJO02_20650 [Reichenbachiella sp.]|uniref:hypothetical protein n=1 Tax=Reichenbachiella sp. TaxID=2184521 RepID=UPI0032973C37